MRKIDFNGESIFELSFKPVEVGSVIGGKEGAVPTKLSKNDGGLEYFKLLYPILYEKEPPSPSNIPEYDAFMNDYFEFTQDMQNLQIAGFP